MIDPVMLIMITLLIANKTMIGTTILIGITAFNAVMLTILMVGLRDKITFRGKKK
jgi:hypothetical protein